MAAPTPQQQALSAAIHSVSTSRTPACILDASGSFLFVNEAWERLPPDAGGPPEDGATLVGHAFASRVAAGPLRDACSRVLGDTLAGRATTPRVLQGEWNDATIARLVSTRVEPLVASGAVIGLVVQRAIARERPVVEVYEVEDRGDAAYADDRGGIVRCACCGRVRDASDPERWDYVPRLARADATQGLCELCAELHVGA